MHHGVLKSIEAHLLGSDDRPAFFFQDQILKTSVLLEKSHRVKNALGKLQIPHQACVAYIGRKNLNQSIALYSIIASGRIFLGIDPDSPRKLQAQKLEQSDCQMIITDSTIEFFHESVPILKIDDLLEYTAIDNEVVFGPEDIAYYMFTSGTTGKPAGVKVTHQNLAHRFQYSPYNRLVNEGDKVAGVTHIEWNPCIYETLFVLAKRASTVLLSKTKVANPECLAQSLERFDIQFLRVVPSLLLGLVQSGWRGKPDLTLVAHGDRISPKLFHQLTDKAKIFRNTYGATEASVFTTIEMDREDQFYFKIDTQNSSRLFVLDDQFEEIKEGEVVSSFTFFLMSCVLSIQYPLGQCYCSNIICLFFKPTHYHSRRLGRQ